MQVCLVTSSAAPYGVPNPRNFSPSTIIASHVARRQASEESAVSALAWCVARPNGLSNIQRKKPAQLLRIDRPIIDDYVPKILFSNIQAS